jgi:hypothetical protein
MGIKTAKSLESNDLRGGYLREIRIKYRIERICPQNIANERAPRENEQQADHWNVHIPVGTALDPYLNQPDDRNQSSDVPKPLLSSEP